MVVEKRVDVGPCLARVYLQMSRAGNVNEFVSNVWLQSSLANLLSTSTENILVNLISCAVLSAQSLAKDACSVVRVAGTWY